MKKPFMFSSCRDVSQTYKLALHRAGSGANPIIIILFIEINAGKGIE
jgi:hypothetical protein